MDVWLHNPDMVGNNAASANDKKAACAGAESEGDPTLDYRLLHTESEGWVISHTDAATLRPEPDAPFAPLAVDVDSLLADELPGLLKGEKSKVKCGGSGGGGGGNKKVLSSVTKENNGVNGVKRYEMNGGHLSMRKVNGESADAAAADSGSLSSVNGGGGGGPGASGDTTYIRCTDKSGKPFYLPVKILPSNHPRAASPQQLQQQDWLLYNDCFVHIISSTFGAFKLLCLFNAADALSEKWKIMNLLIHNREIPIRAICFGMLGKPIRATG